MDDFLRLGRRAVERSAEQWMRRRAAEAAAARQMMRAGQRVWERAIRTGEDIVARTPGEIRAIGAGIVSATTPGDARLRQPSTARRVAPRALLAPLAPAAAAGRLTTIDWRRAAQEHPRQAMAALHGAADELTFGAADWASAGLRTLAEGGIDDWGDRIHDNMEEERSQDRYDAEHYGAARLAGQAAGTVGSMFIPGGAIVRGGRLATTAARLALRGGRLGRALPAAGRVLARAERAAARLLPLRKPGAAATSAAERVAWLLGPGAVNAGVQAGVDLALGQTPTWQDVGGAFAGGVMAGRARGLRPAQAAALSAAATSAYQDRFNGREVSPVRAAESAMLGSMFSHLAGGRALRAAQAPTVGKGAVGEAMGATRMLINGRLPRLSFVRTPWGQPLERIQGTGRGWYPDAQSGNMRFEFKLGDARPLQGSQRLAREWLGDNFTLYHFVPEDVGQLAGMGAGFFGNPLADRIPE